MPVKGGVSSLLLAGAALVLGLLECLGFAGAAFDARQLGKGVLIEGGRRWNSNCSGLLRHDGQSGTTSA